MLEPARHSASVRFQIDSIRAAIASALAVSLLTSIISTSVFAQASVGARVENANGGLCAIGAPAVPSGSPTSMAVVATAIGGCTIRASAYSYLGVVGARASGSLQSAGGPSASFQGFATSSWTDNVLPTFAGRFSADASIDRLRIRYNVGATGSVAASGCGTARIEYVLSFSGRPVASGNQDRNGCGVPTFFSSGQFGTITGTFDVAALGIVNGSLAFNSFSISMISQAYAGLGQGFGEPASVTVDADFGSTLAWNGIAGIEALDAAGNVVDIPDGVFGGLVGNATGFDYRNAAPREGVVSTVPEPSTIALTAGGLLLMLLQRRRRQRQTRRV